MTSFPNARRFRGAGSELQTEQSKLIVELLKKPKKYKVIGADDARGKTVEIMDRKTRVRRTFHVNDFLKAKKQLAGW